MTGTAKTANENCRVPTFTYRSRLRYARALVRARSRTYLDVLARAPTLTHVRWAEFPRNDALSLRHARKQANTHARIHAHTFTCTSMYANVGPLSTCAVRTQARRHAGTHARTQARTHARTHARTNMHAQVRLFSRTHKRT